MSRFATDLLRVIAVCCIVFNHATWNGFVELGTGRESVGAWLIAVINQLGKPATLLFFFLSGYAFGAHRLYGGGATNFRTSDFYRNRALRILPPFLIMSVFGFLYHGLRGKSELSLTYFLAGLPGGAHLFHLYFVAVLLYLYLAYPLLRRLRFRVSTALLLCVPSVLTYIFLDPHASMGLLESFGITIARDSRAISAAAAGGSVVAWTILFSYALPFFVYGKWLGESSGGQQADAPAPWPAFFAEPRRRFRVVTALLPVGFILVFYDFCTSTFFGATHPDPAGRVWRPVVALYAVLWIAWLAHLPERPSGNRLRELARVSFLVYLSHPILMFALAKLPFGLRITLVLGLAWPLALALHGLAKLHPWIGLLLGEGDRLTAKDGRATTANPATTSADLPGTVRAQ